MDLHSIYNGISEHCLHLQSVIWAMGIENDIVVLDSFPLATEILQSNSF